MTARPVDEEPEVTVRLWGIMQDCFGYRLVGMHITERGSQSPRVSSPLVAFDEHSMMAKTSSGRLYHLSGPPDDELAAKLVRAHIRQWGLTAEDAALAEPWEVAMAFAKRGPAVN